jgi:hypothetical protein
MWVEMVEVDELELSNFNGFENESGLLISERVYIACLLSLWSLTDRADDVHNCLAGYGI